MALLLMRFRVFLEKLYDLGKNLQFAAVCLHETEQQYKGKQNSTKNFFVNKQLTITIFYSQILTRKVYLPSFILE